MNYKIYFRLVCWVGVLMVYEPLEVINTKSCSYIYIYIYKIYDLLANSLHVNIFVFFKHCYIHFKSYIF